MSSMNPANQLDELGQRTLRKVRNRLMPLIVLLYFVAYLDRNNVGFAKLTMSEDIGLSATAYGLGAGMFFIGYALLEIPSNAGMYKYGARRWIARILISWGIFATAMALVNGETTFYIVRFLLGAAEAGFFPAILFFLTLWFPAAQRVTVLGIFILAQPVSNALGAPVSGLLLQMDGILGLQGWQWLYIIEGVPAILLGLLTPVLMTDRPEHAHWLADDEREWLTRTMDAELAHRQKGQPHHFLAGLKDSRTIAYSALYFGLVCGIYGLGLWLPTIVAALGKFSTTQVGFIVAVPYTVAAFFVYYWGRRSDRTGNRVLYASISMVMAAVGLLAAGFLVQVNAILAMLALTLAAMGIYSTIAPFLAMPATALVGAAAAAGLAMVNSLGNLGGFVAPYAVGLFNDATGDNRSGLIFLAACLAITAAATYLYARKRPEGHVRPGTHATVGEEAVAADEFDIQN
ncbi:ACS family tartrate transporter-like MFS transporter [Arthrobacter sp. B3I9]|jgi:MFS transporter, ACS family, tartrate transporter|uniref:MFS transporter n=1 Tax=Arthrobacter sp. B3I9 TaxID=3042270 RepID=UPI00279102DA|nr:MFS transporter [Arthrobacter sp. B3I9]MDQ0848350.1 ACS family tartrate transporter-like MFS transporter [Arthrobacter sp. B3I9]